MPLLTLNLSCENVKYPARKHFEKTNIKAVLSVYINSFIDRLRTHDAQDAFVIQKVCCL